MLCLVDGVVVVDALIDIRFTTTTTILCSLLSSELEKKQVSDFVLREAYYGITCLRLIEYFDQKLCLIYIEMIPLLVEKIRINWFPWDSQWKPFEAVQSREWKMSQKIAPKASWKCLI